MDRYVKEMQMKIEDIKEKECRRHFLFGENVYKNKRELRFPIYNYTDILRPSTHGWSTLGCMGNIDHKVQPRYHSCSGTTMMT